MGTSFNQVFLTGKLLPGFGRWSFWLQLLLFIALSVLLYIPVINNTFLSDDYWVLRKLVQDKQLNLDGFFRPLSDITIYLTYLLFGLKPMAFYLSSIVWHAFNALLIYYFCLRWRWTDHPGDQQLFACIAALLFLTYPFHNESVAWIVGRGALMADSFGLAALLILTGQGKEYYKIAGICLCYFIGLTAYESIIFLPAMVVVYLWMQKKRWQLLLWYIVLLSGSLLLHIILRVVISGSVSGDYGVAFLHNNLLNYAISAFKVVGRILLPPSDHPKRMLILFATVLLLIAFMVYHVIKRIKGNREANFFFYTQLIWFVIATIIPAIAQVSTRTSEGDRFLHLPSYFFSMLLAFSLVILFRNSRWLPALFTLILFYQIVFLEKNNSNWQKASLAVTTVLDIVSHQDANQKTFIVNLPDEIDGAFVFRNGFQSALLLHDIDTSRVIIVNHLKRDDALQLKGSINIRSQANQLFIPPIVSIQKINDSSFLFITPHINVPVAASDRIIYWDKHGWKEL